MGNCQGGKLKRQISEDKTRKNFELDKKLSGDMDQVKIEEQGTNLGLFSQQKQDSVQQIKPNNFYRGSQQGSIFQNSYQTINYNSNSNQKKQRNSNKEQMQSMVQFPAFCTSSNSCIGTQKCISNEKKLQRASLYQQLVQKNQEMQKQRMLERQQKKQQKLEGIQSSPYSFPEVKNIRQIEN